MSSNNRLVSDVTGESFSSTCEIVVGRVEAEAVSSALSASRPIGPPGPPPHLGLVVHHFSSPKRFSVCPSRERCWAVISTATTSRERSRRESASVAKMVLVRLDIVATGPSMIPPRAAERSEGVR